MSTEHPGILANCEEAEWELHTIRDFIRFCVSAMNSGDVFLGHGTDDVFAEATALVMQNLNLMWDANEEILDARLLSSEKKAILGMLRRRIVDRIPLAYLTNIAYFCDLPFYVDERVLIPRSPVAELIRARFSPWLQEDPETVLDLCTGSGCIAIALAEVFENALVDAVDISPDAMEVAALNIDHHEMDGRVELIQSDLFKQLGSQRYDLIVSNPPYVSAGSMADLPEEYSYEPEQALLAGRDGLDLVRVILAEAADHLTVDGLLVLEVGESRWNLEQEYPEVDFEWVNLESLAEGVLVLTAEQCRVYQALFAQHR